QVVELDPIPPARLQPNVPRDLDTICLKCLAKESRKRYSGADELADDLDRYLAGAPVRARRTPAWERSLKWARRHPTAATLLVLGLAAGSGSAAAWQRYDARLRREAGQEEARLGTRRRGASRGARAPSTGSATATPRSP